MKTFLGLTLALATLAGAPGAHAAKTVYTGTNCQPYKPGYDYRRNTNGFMYNNRAQSSYQWWDCPIERRTTNDVQSARVAVLDRGIGTDFTCTLRSIKHDGSYYYYNAKTAEDSGLDFLHYGALNAYGANGTLTLRCRVPDKSVFGTSGVFNYLIVE